MSAAMSLQRANGIIRSKDNRLPFMGIVVAKFSPESLKTSVVSARSATTGEGGLRMKKLGWIVSVVAFSWALSQTQGLAQRGQGGGSQHPARGGGVMTAPGRTGTPDQGMPSTQQQGRAQQRTGKPTGSESDAAQDVAKGPRTVTQQLASNSKLNGKVQELFPAGTQLSDAAAGFKNLGDFVSAAHVSHNLGIPFSDLKARMMGGKSLGEAIHELRPDVDHEAGARKANEHAKKVLKESGL